MYVALEPLLLAENVTNWVTGWRGLDLKTTVGIVWHNEQLGREVGFGMMRVQGRTKLGVLRLKYDWSGGTCRSLPGMTNTVREPQVPSKLRH